MSVLWVRNKRKTNAIAIFVDDDDASFAAQNELEPLNLSVNL